MTRFANLYILLPCHSFDDFPIHPVGKEAANLLNCWTVLWHPRLIAEAETTPKWHQAESCPPDLTDSLVIVPTISSDAVEPDLRSKCEQVGAVLVEQDLKRTELGKVIFSSLEQKDDSAPNPISEDRIADFYALGYGYLQVQLLTRHLRYSSSLDEMRFSELVLEAAQSAIAESGNADTTPEETEAKLQACFDLLLEERNGYYPVEASLLDYTLLAETTIGKSLREQLKQDRKMNLLMTGSLAKTISDKHPETLAAIHAAIEAEKLDLIGTNHKELATPLLGRNTIVRNLLLGQQQIEDTFGVAPTAYARRTTGLSPALPEILEKIGIHQALHCTLDEGRIPVSSIANMRWESPAGEMVVALAQPPVDANRPETFLTLSITIGEMIDNEHCAYVLLAHWPNRYSDSFEDLLRVHKYGPLLGNFLGFNECFDSVYDPGYGETCPPEEYRNAYLKQSVAAGQANPISRYIDYWQRTWRLKTLENLLLMSACYNPNAEHHSAVSEVIDQLPLRIDHDTTHGNDTKIDDLLDDLESRLTQGVAGLSNNESDSITVLNTTHFPRTQKIVSEGNTPNTSAVEAIYLRASDNNQTTWIINCPPMGHAILDPAAKAKKTKPIVPVVDDYTMRNEYFRIKVDPETGGMRSLNLYSRRANLVTQQLAMRRFSGHPAIDKCNYSQMVAKDVSVVAHTPLAGVATSQGDLTFGTEKVAEFQQRIEVTRGCKLIRFEVEFDLLAKLESENAWNTYFCNRFAWLDEAASLTRDFHGIRCPVTEQKISAPNFIEISEPDYQLTFLTGGIPFHQRTGRRQLDSILVVPNESRRKFRFALSVNHRYAHQAIADWMQAPIVLQNTELTSETGSWLFHFNAKNLALLQNRPIFEESGKLCGVKLRFQETEGRRGDLKIRCPYQIKRAFLLDLQNHPIQELSPADDLVQTDFLGSQMLDIQINW